MCATLWSSHRSSVISATTAQCSAFAVRTYCASPGSVAGRRCQPRSRRSRSSRSARTESCPNTVEGRRPRSAGLSPLSHRTAAVHLTRLAVGAIASIGPWLSRSYNGPLPWEDRYWPTRRAVALIRRFDPTTPTAPWPGSTKTLQPSASPREQQARAGSRSACGW